MSAQESHTLNTEITDVTVFLKKAQVARTGTINLTKGEHVLKLKGISPYVDKRSIQFSANRSVTVLGVNYQLNYIDDEYQSSDLTLSLNTSIDSLSRELNKYGVMKEVVNEDIQFLRANRQVVNEEKLLTVSEIQDHASYQSTTMTKLKLRRLELEHQENEISRKISRYYAQQAAQQNQSDAKGLIEIKVDVKQHGNIPILINYVTDNASWIPSYDIIVDDLQEPMVLSYKANVIQNTKEDWTNVNLTFSSNNPELSPVAPELQTYYLDYGLLPPSYDGSTAGSSGVVTDVSGEPLIGASIIIKGTTIGTITDLDGSFELPQINGNKTLEISYVGYVAKEVPISDDFTHIVLENGELLEEVVVTGLGRVQNKSSITYEDEVGGNPGSAHEIKIRGLSSVPNAPLPVTLAEKTTNVSFKIDLPYTIESDNQASVITMSTIVIPVGYQYHTIPKVNTNAYLIARINDWEQYNFLAGQLSVVLDGTYIGSSLLDLGDADEILELSLGIDKSVSITRQRNTDYIDKRFLSKRQTESVGWKTIIKNNKEQAINIKVLDQVPVSTNDDIEVDITELSRAHLNEENGICTWELSLNPNEQRQLDLKYQVKYPRKSHLIIE